MNRSFRRIVGCFLISMAAVVKSKGAGPVFWDGRARSLTEAILWHGGEAQGARESFRAMTRPERDALVKFVESI